MTLQPSHIQTRPHADSSRVGPFVATFILLIKYKLGSGAVGVTNRPGNCRGEASCLEPNSFDVAEGKYPAPRISSENVCRLVIGGVSFLSSLLMRCARCSGWQPAAG
jgi:hypothetical protein